MKINKVDSLLVYAFPVVLSIGISLIPVVSDYSNHAVAAAAVNKTGRWFAGHILSSVAFGLSLISVNTIGAYLKDMAYKLPGFTFILMAVGAGLYAAGLGADGIGPVALGTSNLDPSIFFDGSGWWVSGTFMAATAFFGIGLISLVAHANNAKMVLGLWRYVIFISALLFVVAPAIPSGWGLYGVAIASLGVFFPLGSVIRRSS